MSSHTEQAPKAQTIAGPSLAAAGVGVGILAGALAQSLSDRYGEEESAALRITAHATIPFMVAASVLTDRVGSGAAVALRGGFIGSHLVHMRLIARLVRDHGSEPLVRAELSGGTPLYGLIALQTSLLTPAVQARVGAQRAERLTRRIDTQLLRVYCVAAASGLLRHRRPLPVYAGLAALLAGGLRSRGRHR
jgi:hypothetical protein